MTEPATVGYHWWWDCFCRPLVVTHLSKSDGSIQDVNAAPFSSNFEVKLTILRYIQMSFMAFGGMIETDRHLRAYESRSRIQRRQQNDEAVWNEWEHLLKEEERLEKLKQQRRQDGS